MAELSRHLTLLFVGVLDDRFGGRDDRLLNARRRYRRAQCAPPAADRAPNHSVHGRPPVLLAPPILESNCVRGTDPSPLEWPPDFLF